MKTERTFELFFGDVGPGLTRIGQHGSVLGPRKIFNLKKNDLWEILQGLEAQEQAVIYLRFWEGMEIEGIARQFKVSWAQADFIVEKALLSVRCQIFDLLRGGHLHVKHRPLKQPEHLN